MHYNYAIIHLKNLEHNLRVIQEITNNAKILIPVKSNAYGFGIIEIAKFLDSQNIDYLGVAYPFEAIMLRKSKIRTPILVFGEVLDYADAKKIIDYNITPTLVSDYSFSLFNKISKGLKKKIKVHINIDTGMGRIGISYEKAVDFVKKVCKRNNFEVEGIYTHLSSADNDKKFTLEQIKRFRLVLKELNFKPKLIHILNSAGIINFPQFAYDMVRPGIMFYGYFPDNKIRKNIPIKSGLSLKGRITFIKEVKKNFPVSYGHTYWTKRREKLATISGGYGDGINRLLSNRHKVLIQNKLCRIRGRICMDQFMVDVTGIKRLKIGDEVIIWDGNKIKLEEIARKLDTIPYELICNIGIRVARYYEK